MLTAESNMEEHATGLDHYTEIGTFSANHSLHEFLCMIKLILFTINKYTKETRLS